MNPEEIQEIAERNHILHETVSILNFVGAFMNAQTDSPMEDQAQAALNERVQTILTKTPALLAHIVIALGCMLHEVADWGEIQEWISQQEARLQEEWRALRANDEG